MLMVRVLTLLLFLFSPRTGSDAGCGIDPNGCHGGFRVTAQSGGGMDPNGGGGAMDPNGRPRSTTQAGGEMDPNGGG